MTLSPWLLSGRRQAPSCAWDGGRAGSCSRRSPTSCGTEASPSGFPSPSACLSLRQPLHHQALKKFVVPPLALGGVLEPAFQVIGEAGEFQVAKRCSKVSDLFHLSPLTFSLRDDRCLGRGSRPHAGVSAEGAKGVRSGFWSVPRTAGTPLLAGATPEGLGSHCPSGIGCREARPCRRIFCTN
jgi:hypothetical protein